MARFDVFLLEGVRFGWRGATYALVAKNLGLVAQANHLRLPQGAERLPLDMTQEEFAREVAELPIRWRAFLWLLRPLLWAVTLSEAGRHAVWDSFSRESHTRSVRRVEGPMDALIKTKRDSAMCRRLQDFVEDPIRRERAAPVAVVAGAAHMPALYATLSECGYEKGNVRWFEVLDGLTVPSRQTDGRARSTNAATDESARRVAPPEESNE